jgi:hypothetical protein
MEFKDLSERLHTKLDVCIIEFSFLFQQELKFANELKLDRQKGNWVKTVVRDVNIKAHQTDIFVIEQEDLQQCEIIMLKYLERIDQQRFTIYKIFNIVDVRDKNALRYTINTYADRLFG